MADEDKIQKQMEFIIEQQAQFASDIQQLREVQANTEDLLGRLAAATVAGFKELNEKVFALVDAQIKSEERFSDAQIKSEEKFSALAEAQTRADERLNSFISVVERYISNNNNGNSQA